MKISAFFSILALILSLSGTAQAGVFDFLEDAPAAGELLHQITCNDKTVRAEYPCNLAPFRGVYVCRQNFSFLGYSSQSTVCAADVAVGVTLGLAGDTCGPCEEMIPKSSCPCGCGDQLEDGTYTKSYVQSKLWGERTGPKMCLSNSMVGHLTGATSRIQCLEVCEEEEEEEEEFVAEETVQVDKDIVIEEEDIIMAEITDFPVTDVPITESPETEAPTSLKRKPFSA